MTIAKAHHYAIDAASLLETCLTRLRETMTLDRRKRHVSLVDMETALVTTERLLLAYICQQIDLEREAASDVVHIKEEDSDHDVPPTLLECIEIFQTVLEAKKQRQQLRSRHAEKGLSRGQNRSVNVSFASNVVPLANGGLQNDNVGTVRPTFDHSRSPVDSLLFRLIVALQLSLVRIDDARFVITGHRYRDDEKSIAESSRKHVVGIASTVCVLGVGSFWFVRWSKSNKPPLETRGMLLLSGKVALVALTGKILVRQWGNLWMTAKIMKSTADVEEWQQQWLLVQTTGTRRDSLTSPDAKSQRLIEYALSQSPKVRGGIDTVSPFL